MKYELIVFDWDGTLMDSEARIVTCMQRAAKDTGRASPSDEAVREIIGLSLERAVSELFDSNEADTKVICEAYRDHWLGDEIPHSALFPHAGEVVAQLSDEGYLLAIATGKSRRGLDKVLEECGLGPRFHASRCADETFSKPHPQMLEEILTDLNTDPARALVIGDTEYDMQMAANAGTAALAVSYGVHERERLMRQRALHCVDSLSEIPPWVAGLSAPMVATSF